ncbi:hypothetical protein HMN09_00404100 [Mycena chlorophos]|uniref:Uncharacterized protein n=1 Tax=Mycena chlorophos TaxID=658473 RepID=A0A8H6TFR5_MYCCL|nr:hypothetical protein HMN09_00404100 [Mycena chlorophos]
MEAFFDNKTNLVNARICAGLDKAIMYTVETKFEFQGRFRTVLRDENPVGENSNMVVGVINWRDKSMEVGGKRRKLDEVRRTKGSLFNKQRFWKWSSRRKEYELSYTHEEWKATLEDGKVIAGRFCVPFRPHLFHKSEPPVVNLTSTALIEDEVFLLLVFIYEEVKRQDKTNTSVSGGNGSW